METNAPVTLRKSLSPIHVCALALGCIVGWIGFVAPGADYLPSAGPGGTLLAIAVAALAMTVFAANYGYMVKRLPVAGGEFAFARSAFGGTHAFVCVWFLGLAYLCPVALNATAIGFVARTLFHDTLMVGPHWSVAGYEVYLPPLALSVGAIALVAALCARGVRDTGVFQTVIVLALTGGTIAVAGALAAQPGVWAAADPALHPAAAGGRSILPRSAALPKPGPASGGTAALRLPEGFRAVLVDDVPINLRILDLHVKGIGVKDIAQAASGREALKAIAERRPDVVLSDMWMPEMSGADLATEIRKHKEYDGIPFVAVTADNDVGATFDASLFAEIVTKPVTADRLRLALMRLFPNAR